MRREAKTIRGLVVPVEGPMEEVELRPTLDAFRSAIGDGYLEALRVRIGATPMTLYCDDEGLRKGLPFNRVVSGHRIHGPFLLVGTPDREGDDTSLTLELIEDLKEVLS